MISKCQQNLKTQNLKRVAIQRQGIHLFDSKIKKNAALVKHQHFRRAHPLNDDIFKPTTDIGHPSLSKHIIHRQEKSLPKDPICLDSYECSSKGSNISDTLVGIKKLNNAIMSNESNGNVRDFHMRNLSPGIRINIFKPMHFRMHSEKPLSRQKQSKTEDLIDSSPSVSIAKELGLPLRGECCPFENKASIEEYIVGKEIGMINNRNRKWSLCKCTCRHP